MHVLMVESDAALGAIWKRHLIRAGKQVTLVANQDEAVAQISATDFSILILDIMLEYGSAFAVADYAGFRRPGMKIIFVTRRSFFADGSIFNHAYNACAMVNPETRPADIDAVVDHYGLR